MSGTPSVDPDGSYSDMSVGGYTTSGFWYSYDRSMKAKNNTEVTGYSALYIADEISKDGWLFG